MSSTTNHVKLPRLLGVIFYDLLVIVTLLLSATSILFIFLSIIGFAPPEPHNINFRIYLFTVIYAYYYICWTYIPKNQTIGMRAWNIRLVNNISNKPLSYSQTLLRIIGGILGFISFGLGYFLIFCNKQRKSLADYLSDSQLQIIKTNEQHSNDK